MSNETNDGVIGTLANAVAEYAAKPVEMSSLKWVQEEFAKEKDVWDSDEQRRQDASEIIAMTDAFDRERERYDAARAEGRSSANYLMGLIDESVNRSGAENPGEIKKQIYSSVIEGGKAILKEVGYEEDADSSNEQLPEWNEENKGEMVREMSGSLAGGAVLALGKISGALVDAAEKRVEKGDDGDPAITSYIDKESGEKSCKGLGVPMSAAIVKCARRGLLGETIKKMPADAITTATCVASEGVKTLVRVGKGELTLDEGREKIAETVYVAAGAYIGKKAGEKAGRYLGNFVGGIFGPVGSAVCGKICEKVGGFIGHKVGGVVGKVVHKVAKVYRKAKEWLGGKIGGVVRSVGSAIGRGCRKVLSIFGF